MAPLPLAEPMPPPFDSYRSTVPGLVWPPLVEGTGALLLAWVARLEESEWLPAATIATHQRAQLGVLAQHCAAHSSAFAARLRVAGLEPADLARPGGLQRLPPLTRRDLQHGDGLFCGTVPESHLPLGENSTSGSTGEPVTVRRTTLNQLGWMGSSLRDHRWQRRDAALRLAGMSAHNHAIVRRPDWGSPHALVYRTGPAIMLPTAMDLPDLIAELEAFQPEVLVVYPTILAELLDTVGRPGHALASVRHLRCMSEVVHPDLRDRVRALLGLTLEDAYTSMECGFIALNCPSGDGYHVMAETHLVEVVDEAGQPCRPGEMGRVLVTDLHNFATPLIRYEIGDYAVVGGPCTCGRGLRRLERIVGRERNLVCHPNGHRCWPFVGYKRYRTVAPVRQYQLVQHDLQTIEMRLVVERALTSGEEAALRAVVQESLGHPFAIALSYHADRLKPGPSGKTEEFVCLIDPG